MWHRIALQVNPYSYTGRRAPRDAFASEDDYNAALVQECRRLGIGLIGITDHWCASGSVGLVKAAEAGGIVALPGFEAVSSEGIHLLALFERNTPVSRVDAAIGGCGGTPGCEAGRPGRPYADIVRCVVDRGGVIIPAHVNGPDGLFTGLASGSAKIAAWRNADVSAVAVTPSSAVTEHQRAILDNADAQYAREHPVAELHADDISDPARLATPGASCWVKTAAPSLNALQLAFRTPATRVRLTDPEGSHHPVIEAVTWEGGFLDGVRIRFSDSMTCLIGGRGSGKSTVIESLRFAMGSPPIGTAAARGHDQMRAGVLQAGTRVSIAVRSGSVRFTVERTVGSQPIVRDPAGSVLASRPADVLGPVDVFSQHELAELAESPDYVAELLRRLTTAPPTPVASVRPALRRNRENLLAALRDLERLDEQIEELPRLREAVSRSEAEGLDDRVAEQADVDRRRGLLASAREHVDEVAAAGSSLRAIGALEARATLALEDELDEQVRHLAERLRSAVIAAVTALNSATDAARSDLISLEQDCSERADKVRDGYEAALRALQGTGLNTERYLATRAAVQRLEPMAARRPEVDARVKALRAERRSLLTELDTEAASDRSRVAEVCSRVGTALRGIVRVRPVPSPSREEILRLIETLPGQRTQIRRAVADPQFSPRAFADAARRGPHAVTETFGISGAQAASLAAAGEAFFLELEETTVPTAVEAMLNVADGVGNDFRMLDELSQGQKATALLLLLLTSSRSPLVIDQPEDDLDNRFIWEGVVPRLRRLKSARQVVFSTHNANIPVLGDAELVVALECADRRGRVVAGGAGSLDEAPVRMLAEQVLEGGREAFGRRRYLYGF